MRKLSKHETGTLQGGGKLGWEVFPDGTVLGQGDLSYMTLSL